MNIHGNHLINGEWKSPAGGEQFSAQNPATGKDLSPAFSEADNSEVQAAMLAAADARDQLKYLPHDWPAGLLDAIARQIMQLGDALLERAEQETALPQPRLIGERARTCNQLKMFAELLREGSWVDAVIDTADPNRTPAPKPDVRRMFRPRGPVVVFGASNFPFAFSVCGGDTASALAAGNPVIAKGHPSHPGTSELFAAAVLAALKESNLPLGLFAMLQGRSHQLGAALVKHSVTAAVGFTGSQKAGRALFDLAAARPNPIPVYAEMGSLNPLVILPGAIREKSDAIAKGLAGSILLGGGQFCTKPGIIFVLGEATAFIEALTKQIAAAPPITLLNSGICNAFLDRTADWPNLSGVQVHVAPKQNGLAASPGIFETTAADFHNHPEIREETFGPAALIVRCNDMHDLEEALQTIGGSLTGTLHIGSGDDARTALRMLERIAGRVIVNGYPTGVEVNHAIVHGGPYPATTDSGSTSVGTAAIRRFVRLQAWQDVPDVLLPPELQNANPLAIWRTVNGKLTRDPIPANQDAAAGARA
jgi:NADP-dependent aldehyde dehydrogenase